MVFLRDVLYLLSNETIPGCLVLVGQGFATDIIPLAKWFQLMSKEGDIIGIIGNYPTRG